jgi:CRP/FNR family transcriptional regulator
MLDRHQKKAILTNSILFQGLSNELINKLTSLTQQKRYRKGETIFLEGRSISGFYLVAQGQIKIFNSSVHGKEQIFYIIGPGEPFGLTTLFHDKKLPACAASMTTSLTLFFPKTEFLHMVKEHTPLAMSMLAGLSQRMCQLTIKAGELTLKGTPQRLASHLIYLTEQQGRTDKVLLDMPKSQLACLLGTSPENLSRIFATMSRQGQIQVQGNSITLLNYEGLQEYR